jgi:protein gp37
MSDNTKIEWADATVNYVNGCSMVSAGCTNCYAMRLAGTRLKHHPSRAGLTRETSKGPIWTAELRDNETALMQPLRWSRPRRIFWNAHGDLFHESVPDEWIDRQFVVMALTSQHIHMVLTKRPERMRDYVSAVVDCFHASPESMDARFGKIAVDLTVSPCAAGQFEDVNWPLPNVWLGTSVEDQVAADARVPHLLATPAAVRFLSCEPLLGPLQLSRLGADYLASGKSGERRGVDWVIAGGESGPGARPMHPDWARALRGQCHAAGVAFHFKQWGEFLPDDQYSECHPYGSMLGKTPASVHPDGMAMWRVGKRAAGRLLDGRTWDEVPA